MPGRTTNNDPLQGFNRGVYRFNDAVDRAALKPVAQGYQKITPHWLRVGVSNFFNNLEQPWTIVNELLQGKPKAMAQGTCRFVLNSVIGVAGFVDIASRAGLPLYEEDFGQTLAVWGLPSGPYVMLPLFGPSSVRDAPAKVVDFFARPQRYADIPWETDTAITTVNIIDTRSKLLSVEGTLQNAYDRYGVIRDVWVQQREYRIYDGNPPQEKIEDESLEPEDKGSPP